MGQVKWASLVQFQRLQNAGLYEIIYAPGFEFSISKKVGAEMNI